MAVLVAVVATSLVDNIPDKTNVNPDKHPGVNSISEKFGLSLGNFGKSDLVSCGLLVAADTSVRYGMWDVNFEDGG